MAYSKTPEGDTHNVLRVPAIGNQTLTSSVQDYTNRAGRRFVNCFPVATSQKGGDPKYVVKKAPYLNSVTWTFPDTNAGITAFEPDVNLFASGYKIYSIAPNGTSAPTITEVAALGTATRIIITMKRMIDYTANGDLIVAGLNVEPSTGEYYLYEYNKSTDTLTENATAVNAGTGVLYVTSGYYEGEYIEAGGEVAIHKSLFVDGYHVFAIKALQDGRNRIYVSSVGTNYETYSSTDYIVPEIEADDAVDLHKHHNYVVSFGSGSIEFFYNAGNELGSPFSRQENLTMKIGLPKSNGNTASISNGDDIYFVGTNPIAGTGVYLIRDFKLVKVSDDFIDYILNTTESDAGTVAIDSISLGMIDIYGQACLGLEVNAGSVRYTYVLNEKDKVWWEWTDSDATGLLSSSKRVISNLNGEQLILSGRTLGNGSFLNFTVGKIEVLTSSTLKLWYMDKNQAGGARAAELYTDMVDFGNNNYKHIKYVDSLGDYGNNTVELGWTFNSDWTGWSSLYSRTPSTYPYSPVRYHNLGRARRAAFRQRFIGSSDIAHEGLDIYYNVGTR